MFKRYSQRTHLVTLAEINITPLLDLAWNLLIIFMITAPLLEQTINLRLPPGGQPAMQINPQDLILVEIDANGRYFLNGRNVDLNLMEQIFIHAYKQNPNIVVRIRADEQVAVGLFYPVIDRCTRNGITRISLATRSEGGKR